MATTEFKFDGNYVYESTENAATGNTNVRVAWGGIDVAQVFAPSPSPPPTDVTSSYGTFYRGTLQTSYMISGTTTVKLYSVARLIPVSAPTQGSVVFGSDYNAVQTKAAGILGPGTAYGGPTNGYGYGQSVASSSVTPTTAVTKSQWNNLVTDLNKINRHQRGGDMVESTNISNNILSNPISFENLRLLDDIASFSLVNRFNVNGANRTISNLHEGYVPYEWAGVSELQAVTSSVTFTWASQNDMHYWFNAGGVYTIYGRTIGSPIGDQETEWFNMVGNLVVNFTATDLANAIATGGEVALDVAPGVNSPYTFSVARIYAQVINPGDGQLRQVRFRVYFEDNHAPVPDGTDGIRANVIGWRIDEYKTTGAGNGAFDAPSNTFSISYF
jgi:hypothetical protein